MYESEAIGEDWATGLVRRAGPPSRIALRPFAELGETRAPGVIGKHHFCFAGFQHPDRISWGSLRAVHHYQMAPAAERPPTFHAGFEIVTVVLTGRWKRTGSLPAAIALSANEAELISSGIGVTIGSVAAGGADTSILEIWISSSAPHSEPRRQWLTRRRTELTRPVAIGSPAKADALCWDARARLHYGWLEPGEELRSRVEQTEKAYMVIVDGAVRANGTVAHAGDGMAIGAGELTVEALERTRLVWLRGL